MTIKFSTEKYYMNSKAVLDDNRTTCYDIVTLDAISYFINSETRSCFPTIDTLARKAKISRSTLKRALVHLEELGYITISNRCDEVTHRKKSSYYTVNTTYSEVDEESAPKQVMDVINQIQEEHGKEVEEITLSENIKGQFTVDQIKFIGEEPIDVYSLEEDSSISKEEISKPTTSKPAFPVNKPARKLRLVKMKKKENPPVVDDYYDKIRQSGRRVTVKDIFKHEREMGRW